MDGVPIGRSIEVAQLDIRETREIVARFKSQT